MTRTALPLRMVHSTSARRVLPRTGPVLSLHGEDPTSGIPATGTEVIELVRSVMVG